MRSVHLTGLRLHDDHRLPTVLDRQHVEGAQQGPGKKNDGQGSWVTGSWKGCWVQDLNFLYYAILYEQILSTPPHQISILHSFGRSHQVKTARHLAY